MTGNTSSNVGKLPRLLVIDDNPEVAGLVSRLGDELGCRTRTACGWKQIRAGFDEFAPDAVVLDLVMPDVDGIEVLKHLVGRERKVAIVILSGADSRTLKIATHLARASGLDLIATLPKPTPIGDLEEALARALDPELRVGRT